MAMSIDGDDESFWRSMLRTVGLTEGIGQAGRMSVVLQELGVAGRVMKVGYLIEGHT